MKQYSLYNEDPVIRTVTGKWFNAFDPHPDQICIEDIAHALSNQCRFGGHLPKFFSVAQHCILTADIVAPEHRLAALLHDASEAYLLDIPRPVKRKLSNYAEIEDKIMRVIADKYKFQWPLHNDVKKADEIMLQREWSEIMLGIDNGHPLDQTPCWIPAIAKKNFLIEFKLLYEQTRIL